MRGRVQARPPPIASIARWEPPSSLLNDCFGNDPTTAELSLNARVQHLLKPGKLLASRQERAREMQGVTRGEGTGGREGGRARASVRTR